MTIPKTKILIFDCPLFSFKHSQFLDELFEQQSLSPESLDNISLILNLLNKSTMF